MFDPAISGVIVAGLLVFFLTTGVHIGVALGLSGFIGIFITISERAAIAQLATVPFSTTNSFTLAVIPLFILMGSLATQAGLTKDLYKAAYNWLGQIAGGLAMATTLASAAFGAACGSTIVNAAVFTKMAMPEMTKFGYDKRLSAGCIAASGTLASLIPPSILMIIYAVITEQSVARLLVAGLIPGLMSAAIYMGGIYVVAKVRPDLAPIPDVIITRREKWESLKGVWGITFLFILVIGGIYLGFFVPTYAGAVGAFGAFLIVAAKRKMNVIGGIIFARFLTYTGLVGDISDWMLALELSPIAYLFGFALLYLILGMLIDPIAIMVMTLPVMFPIMTSVGYDPIWLGVIAIKLAEISLITPPVGLNVYVVRSASPVPLRLEEVFAGVTPFLIMDLFTLGMLIAFPSIVLLLPNLMN
jgi:C4-dicarboxylate transporter DctM subunit